MPNIINQIETDIVTAMKEKQSEKLDALRMLKSAIKNEQIDHSGDFTDDDAMTIVKREIKKRKDSIEQYTTAGRQDLADKEQREVEILGAYMPEQMSEEEINGIIETVISELESADVGDFGKVMKEVMAKTKGQADGKVVSELLRTKLGS